MKPTRVDLKSQLYNIGMDQGDLANFFGKSRKSINQWMNGKSEIRLSYKQVCGLIELFSEKEKADR